MSKWTLSEKTFKDIGVDDIITMHINKNRFKNVEEVEKELQENFGNSIISVIRTKNGYLCTVFVLSNDVDKYRRTILDAFISLYTLKLLANETEDQDMLYIIEKANTALAKMFIEIGTLLDALER